jgi:HEAT repeat protein
MSRLVQRLVLGAITVALAVGPTVDAAISTSLQKKVDSLFVIASTGEIRYKDMVQPAKDSLIALGADAVPLLIDKLDTKSAGERVAIIDILKKIGKPAVPDLLIALKRDNGLIVERVCNALGEIADSSAVPGLIAVAGRHRWQVREQSVGSLGRCRSHRGDSVVAAALVDTIGQVRKAAAVSAGQLKLNGSTPTLVHMLADDFYGARMCALETLLGLDTANVIHTIGDSLVSSNMQVGDRGCMVLGRLRTERARDLLMIETKSENPNRRAHAGVALINGDPLDSCGLQKQFVEPETDPLVKLKLLSAAAAGKTTSK